MIFPDRVDEFFHEPRPRERTPSPEIIFIRIVRKGLQLEWIVTIGDVMTLPIGATHQIEETVKKPVKDEQHFHLLPEMNLLVAYQLRLIVGLTRDPDKNEER